MTRSSAKPSAWQRGALFVFLAAILLSIAGVRRSPIAQAIERGDRIPILLFGLDAADLSRHTDTLMLTVLDPVSNYLSILSIPRDTHIELPGYRFNRINEVYGYELRTTKRPEAAADMVMKTVGYLLSSASETITIPHYVQLDFSAFRRLIDLLDGVWVTVKTPMNYDDNAGHLHIHMEPGRYLLKGQQALEYVRFRGSTGDRGRIFRQQDFIRSAIKRLANPLMVLRIPEMAAIGMASVSTNLTFSDAVSLVVAARRIRPENVGFYILPGQPHGPYWAVKRDLASELASSVVNGRPLQGDLTEASGADADRITVNVWNASHKSGYAYRVTKFLRQAGYDVLDWGTYPADQLQTRVIDRRGRIDHAQAVAAALGVEDYHSEPNPKVMVDVEVVIGQNYTLPDR